MAEDAITIVPPQLKVMRDITGTLEAPGSADNPVILSWAAYIASKFPEMQSYCAQYQHDAIAWCGLTMAYCMAKSGIRPPFGSDDEERFLWVDSWKNFGTKVSGGAQLGDVLVFTGGGMHHVTMCDGVDGDYYLCRGGNQSDSVKLSRYPKSSVTAVRRAPNAAEITLPSEIYVSTPNNSITATVFGGGGEPQESAYDEHLISDSELGVSLPARVLAPRPKVKVTNPATGTTVICSIVDVGPWNTRDPYWKTGSRPDAETHYKSKTPLTLPGPQQGNVPTNDAGIDLSPAAARAIGIQGKGKVNWQFVGATQQPAPEPPVDTPTPAPTPPTQPPAPPDFQAMMVNIQQLMTVLPTLLQAVPAIQAEIATLKASLTNLKGAFTGAAPIPVPVFDPATLTPVAPAPVAAVDAHNKTGLGTGILATIAALALGATGVTGTPLGVDASTTGALLPLAGVGVSMLGAFGKLAPILRAVALIL